MWKKVRNINFDPDQEIWDEKFYEDKHLITGLLWGACVIGAIIFFGVALPFLIALL